MLPAGSGLGDGAVEARQALLAGEVGFTQVVDRLGIDLDLELLHPLCTITTPPFAPVRFATTRDQVEVSVPGSLSLTVNKEMKHDPSCGAMQWFKPFATLADSAMGVAETHEFSGQGLGTQWSAPNKRSAFFGSFVY